MFSNDDLVSVYEFLKSTGEGNLRKMLVSGKMTDVHLRMLLKVARGCSQSQFIEHCEKETLPKINFSAAESALRETFWMVCTNALMQVGLLQKQKAAA
jgi:hypothetical protein